MHTHKNPHPHTPAHPQALRQTHPQAHPQAHPNIHPDAAEAGDHDLDNHDENASDDDLHDVIDRTLRDMSDEQRREAQEMQDRLDRIQQRLADVPDAVVERFQLLEALPQPLQEIRVDIQDDVQREALQRIETDIDRLRSRVDVAIRLGREAVDGINGPSVFGVRVKYVVMFFRVAVTLGAGKLLMDLQASHTGVGALAVTAPVPAGQPAATDDPDTQALRQQWIGLPGTTEADFWETHAAYVETNRPRPFLEQLWFCQMTVKLAQCLCPTPEGWAWSSPQAKLDQVDRLAAMITNDGLAAALRALARVRDGASDAPLPRAVCGDLISLALVRYWEDS